jgi:hypothetical protein
VCSLMVVDALVPLAQLATEDREARAGGPRASS